MTIRTCLHPYAAIRTDDVGVPLDPGYVGNQLHPGYVGVQLQLSSVSLQFTTGLAALNCNSFVFDSNAASSYIYNKKKFMIFFPASHH